MALVAQQAHSQRQLGASAPGTRCVLNGSSHFDRPQPRKKSKYHGFSPKQNRPQRPLTAGGQPGLQISPDLGDQVSHEFRAVQRPQSRGHWSSRELLWGKGGQGGPGSSPTQTTNTPTPMQYCLYVITFSVMATAGKGWTSSFLHLKKYHHDANQCMVGTRQQGQGGTPPQEPRLPSSCPPSSHTHGAHFLRPEAQDPAHTAQRGHSFTSYLDRWLQIGHRCFSPLKLHHLIFIIKL